MTRILRCILPALLVLAMTAPSLAATLAGTVTRSDSGSPVAGATVIAVSPLVPGTVSGTTAANGTYSLTVPAGIYGVLARSDDLIPEVFDNVPCTIDACDSTLATPIQVAAGTVRSDLNFALEPRGTIAGLVTAEDGGTPLAGVTISASNLDGVVDASTVSGIDGRYVLALTPGPRRVRSSNDQGFIDELHANVSCPAGICDPGLATTVSVATGASLPGIDFALARSGRISGRVTEAGGMPIDALPIEVVDTNNVVAGSTATVAGDYAVEGLPAGTYFLRTRAPSQFLDEIWDDRPCPRGTCAPATGTPIVVAANQSVGAIDFTLARGGGLSGRVSNEFTSQPLPGVRITIHDSSGVRVAAATTAADGNWISPPLVNGSYTVIFDAAGFDAELYDNLPPD
jgi:hypothetical protein